MAYKSSFIEELKSLGKQDGATIEDLESFVRERPLSRGDVPVALKLAQIDLSGFLPKEREARVDENGIPFATDSSEDGLSIKERVKRGQDESKQKFLKKRMSDPMAALSSDDRVYAQSLEDDVLNLKAQEVALRKRMESEPSIRRSLEANLGEISSRKQALQDALIETGTSSEDTFKDPEPGWLDNASKTIHGWLTGGNEQEKKAKTPKRDEGFGNQFLELTNKAAQEQKLADAQELRNQEGLAELRKITPKNDQESAQEDHINVIESKVSNLLKMGLPPERVVAERDNSYRNLAIKILVQEGKPLSEAKISSIAKILSVQKSKE